MLLELVSNDHQAGVIKSVLTYLFLCYVHQYLGCYQVIDFELRNEVWHEIRSYAVEDFHCPVLVSRNYDFDFVLLNFESHIIQKHPRNYWWQAIVETALL